MKTETLHDRYLAEVKDLYSAEHPLLDAADCHAAERRHVWNGDVSQAIGLASSSPACGGPACHTNQ